MTNVRSNKRTSEKGGEEEEKPKLKRQARPPGGQGSRLLTLEMQRMGFPVRGEMWNQVIAESRTSTATTPVQWKAGEKLPAIEGTQGN